MRDLTSPPTVGQVAADLKAPRRGVGITVDRLRDKQHLLRLPAVLADAEKAGRNDDLTAVAYALIECVLTQSTLVPPRFRHFVAIELNLEEFDDIYEDRKSTVINEWLGVRDYRRAERDAYERVALALTMLSRSPCSASPEVAQAEARFRTLREVMKNHSKTATAHLLELYGNADSVEQVEQISRRLYEALPGARTALRRMGYEPTRPVTFRQVVAHLLNSVLTVEYVVWKRVSPDDVMDDRELRVALGIADLAGDRVKLRADSRFSASLRLLGIVVEQVEDASDWPHVLAPDATREAVPVAE